jgi:hypothetical protein
MKKVIGIAGTILVLIMGYVAIGPFLTFSAIKTGITEKDSVKLSENIDFPILRNNLKEQINAAIIKDATSKSKDKSFIALKAALVQKKITDKIIDSFITPGGLSMIMNENEPKKKEPQTKDEIFKNSKFSYDSMNKFSIWITDEEGKEIRFVLGREWLAWKLINIIIPFDENA